MNKGHPPLIGIAGYKHVGKTTLVERLVRELSGRGLRVATIKHAHHDIQLDEPGRDSYRHRMAGAQEAAIVSSTRWAVIGELRGTPEPTLEDVVSRLSPADLVVVEGYKPLDFPKIEVRRAGHDRPKLAGAVPNIIAVASDGEAEPGLPQLDLDDIPAIADFVAAYLGIKVPA